MWHSGHGEEPESNFLRGRDVERAMQGTVTYCQCSSCTQAVWDRVVPGAGLGYRCGDWISWYSCLTIANAFPTVCGGCNSMTCTNPTTSKPSLKPTTSKPSLKPTPGDTASFIVTPPPASLNISPFYTKYVSARGLPVVASGVVNNYALFEAAYLVNLMLSRRPDILAALIASKSQISVMSYTQFTTDIPEHALLLPKDYWDARGRGLGGTPAIPVTSIGEESLLNYPGDPYEGENIFLHEFAHSIHLIGMARVDPTFDGRLRSAYDRARAAGRWTGQYAATNHEEYFAEGTQSWFDANSGTPANNRAQLIAYDPGLAEICREVFGSDVVTYFKPASRLTGHLAGYNPITAPRFVWPVRLTGCLVNLTNCNLFPPITIQAESYRSMFGVSTETTNDVGGGQNVGFIDTGDWMTYPVVTLPSTGRYKVEYRVASQSVDGSLRLENSGGSPVYGSLSISTTGGWQNWVTLSHTVNLNAGSNWFAIFATSGGWKLNWFCISLV